jgi:type IV pilus assembly protein PilQ
MGQLNFSLFNASLTRILNLELQAMETDGKGKTMSNPRVVTRNNVKALIEQGDEIPVVTPGAANAPPTVTYRKAKLSFEVTPQITPDRRVKMKMIISRDRPDWGNTVQGNPTIVTAKVETEVLVDNGGTLVIGGVTIDNETTSTDRIPFLGDLPYVGFLFKMKAVARERNELLVFITPRIVDENLNLR